MPKIFALRDRLMEVQQSLADDDTDVRGKRTTIVDVDDVQNDFNDLSSTSFGLRIFDSFFEKKSVNHWPEPSIVEPFYEGKRNLRRRWYPV